MIILVLAVVLLLGRREKTGEETLAEMGAETEEEVTESVPLYTTPDDSEDPEGDFLNYLEEKKDIAESEDDRFDAEMEVINFQIISGRYEEAEAALLAYDPESLSAQHQFQLYNTFMNLYRNTENHDKFDEYNILSSDARKRIANGE